MFPQKFSIILLLLLISTHFLNLVEAAPQTLVRHIKTDDALRLEISESGLYWLSYEDLKKAGLQAQFINPQRLRLFNQGKEVALNVISENPDYLQAGDYLEFYAQNLDTTFTETNVYWLYWRKKGWGKRMGMINGKITGKGEALTAFYDRLHLEERNRWDIWEGSPDTQDYWFWDRLNASDVKTYSIKLPVLPIAETEIVLRVAFRGRSTAPPSPNHHTVLYLNDSLIGDARWDGDVAYIQEMSVSSSLLNQKNNTLKIALPGDTGAVVDTVYLNWIEIDYWRPFEAVKESLRFTVDTLGEVQIAINHFNQPEILVYDITDPNAFTEIVNVSVIKQKGKYQAVFEDRLSTPKTYYALNINQYRQPSSTTLWQPAKLKHPKNGADYILITDQAFLPAVEPLCALRREQGLRVKSVSVQEIYNEFNQGLSDPAAIKAFLKYAYENWSRPAPTYVFLVGDANMNYRATKKPNKVPAHLYLSVGSKNLLIPDDNWYVDVWSNYMGDYILPEMMIGRIPGDSPKTVARLIEKIIRFEKSTQPSAQNVLLIADSSKKEEILNEHLIDRLPGGFNADKVYLNAYIKNTETTAEKEKQIAKARRDIIASMNKGAMITNYAGHGNVDRWSQTKDLFGPSDVHRLKNEENLTFVLALTCINGQFSTSNKYSLAEEFMLAKGGAIGVFSSSGLTETGENQVLSDKVFSMIFEQGARSLGEITTQAKIAAYDEDISKGVIRSFILFGDPATRLKEW
jgi:hypothetical protein